MWHTIERSGENWTREPDTRPAVHVIEPAQPPEPKKGKRVAFGFARELEKAKKKRTKKSRRS